MDNTSNESMVSFVKRICKEKKIAVSKMEKDLGFGNGYLRSLKNGEIKYSRVKEIADYLCIDENDILECSQEINEGSLQAHMEERAREYAIRISKLEPAEQEEVYDMIEKVMCIITKNKDRYFNYNKKEADTD